MKKLLILGYSNIVQRRVLPAILPLKAFDQIDIASRHLEKYPDSLREVSGTVFSNYQEALKTSKADLVYVSSQNSEHEKWVRAALHSGHNVIVDKPAFLKLEDAEELVQYAYEKDLLLAEALVYAYHPQVAALKTLYKESGNTRIFAQFSVPPFTSDNFRYQNKYGGGALMDLGPYAVSVGRIFFETEPSHVECKILSEQGDVPTAFSIHFQWKNGNSVVGHFGFDTEYTNYLRVINPQVCAWTEPFFTTTPTKEINVSYRRSNQEQSLQVLPSDSFKDFFQYILKADAISRDLLRQQLLQDARLLRQLLIKSVSQPLT